MANKKKEDEVEGGAPAPEAAEPSTALQVAGETDILALSPDGDMAEIIKENFGGDQLTLADLDKIKLPAAGGITWAIPSLDGEDSTKELTGVILAWADKKAWWAASYGESGGGSPPDCKSSDMVHGIGAPNSFFNAKEQQLQDTGKAGMAVRAPGGWLCSTCTHNQFGSAAQGAGKACQDKRFVIMLPLDSLIPILLRVPATSIQPMKQYFKRLAGVRKPYYAVVSTLSLIKVKGTQEYSQIVARAARSLEPHEVAKVKELRGFFQSALDADDAVEQAEVEKKPAAAETLADMPASPASVSDTAAPTPAATDSNPY
jgi:hypothetical protein